MVDFECLVAILERLEAKIDTEQEKLLACRDATEARVQKVEARQEKLEAKMKATQLSL
jgi:hypothetical protein